MESYLNDLLDRRAVIRNVFFVRAEPFAGLRVFCLCHILDAAATAFFIFSKSSAISSPTANEEMPGIRLSFGISFAVTFAQTAEPTPMQLVWSIFAVAAIVLLFTIYHLHLEGKGKKRR